jgi:maltodextrin utilization protein YvdJ
MRSFLKVCRRAGFNSATGFYYWKMFFTVIFRNPKGVETAVNLAAMFIHFQKQKEYSVSTMNHTIDELEKTGEESYNAIMLGNNRRPD